MTHTLKGSVWFQTSAPVFRSVSDYTDGSVKYAVDYCVHDYLSKYILEAVYDSVVNSVFISIYWEVEEKIKSL